MRDQTELKFIIGGHNDHSGGDPMTAAAFFEKQVIAEACRLCGGCTITAAEGYWIKEAAEGTKPTFGGPLVYENALHISLTCENHKVDAVYSAMQNRICNLARTLEVPIDWVHVQRIPITGMHFSVAAFNDEVAA